MTGDKAAEPGPPRTLRQAHVALARIRPHLKAPLGEWLAYYQRSAALYAEIAEIDRRHHHEALYMAEQAQDDAKEIEAQIPMQRPGHA
ncbi:MAG: AMED_5909 family protein [Pseudonocardiaceae bacterium]